MDLVFTWSFQLGVPGVAILFALLACGLRFFATLPEIQTDAMSVVVWGLKHLSNFFGLAGSITSFAAGALFLIDATNGLFAYEWLQITFGVSGILIMLVAAGFVTLTVMSWWHPEKLARMVERSADPTPFTFA